MRLVTLTLSFFSIFLADDSDEFYEWLIWKIAQKYDGERGNGALEKRVNWNALK